MLTDTTKVFDAPTITKALTYSSEQFDAPIYSNLQLTVFSFTHTQLYATYHSKTLAPIILCILVLALLLQDFCVDISHLLTDHNEPVMNNAMPRRKPAGLK
jgi:hypothetical protein